MIQANYHTHCTFDDGHNTMEEVVLQAIALGFDALGFSCHTPGTLQDQWHMAIEQFPAYLKEIETLKSRYGNQIQLYAGLEMEYLDDTQEFVGSTLTEKLDYTIGAVHVMKHHASGRYLSVDGPIEDFETLLADNFNNDAKAFISYYFELQIQMIRSCSFDILAHCDLPKKRNHNNRYFDPSEKWYQKAARRMLEEAAAHNQRLELNTGAIARGILQEPYPSPSMLQWCSELNIPLVLNSDAHKKEHLNYYFTEAKELLKACNYHHLDVLYNNQWSSQPIG